MFRIFLVVLWIGFGGCPSRAQDDAPLLGDSITSLDGVVTVPLIPHHVQQRRRLEQGLVDESILQESIPEYPPRRYARDIMDEEGEPRNLRDADQVAELFQGYGVRIFYIQ